MTRANNDTSLELGRSFAWGQLLAGSIFSGFSVWNLALKVTNTPLSAALVELSTIYGAVRDFVVMPLRWIGLELTSSEKDVLVICFVVLGATLRVTGLRAIGAFAIFVSISLGVDLLVRLAGANSITPNWIVGPLVGGVVLFLVLTPLFLRDPGGPARVALNIFLNIIFTLLWASSLLLLNWATS